MRWLESLWFRIRGLLRRERFERELAEELDYHVEMETRKNLERGFEAREARRQARVAFGGVERMRQRARAAWGLSLLHDLQDDVRFALRQLRKRPAFSVLAVATLGLGIGGTVALFSVVQALLLRPLPYHDDEALISFWSEYNWRGEEFDFVRDVAQAYDGLAAYSMLGGAFRHGDRTSMLLTGAVSANAFEVLGARPYLGRTFQPGEDRPGAEPTLILSYRFWRQEMGGDPDVLGRRVVYDGTPYTVVGVMPEGFFFPAPEVQAWQTLDLDPDDSAYRNNGWLVLFGRLRDGITEEQMQADLDRITAALGERYSYPDAWDKTEGAYVVPLRDSMVGDVRPALLLLLAAVGLLLLMACANVAALLLSRTADRRGEIAVRAVMGAGRGRLARQMLTEAVVLGLLAAAVGVLLARASFDVIVSMLPLSGGFQEAVALDWTALGAALVLATAAGSLVSLAPIRSLLRGDVECRLGGARSQTGSAAGAGRLQGALVLAEALLCVLLISGAALFIRSVAHLRSMDPGLNPEGVLAVSVLPPEAETTPEERGQLLDALLDRVQAMPGVVGVGYTNRLPVRDGGWQGSVRVEDRPDLVGAARPSSMYRTATPGTFEALGLTIVRGRAFESSDRAGAPDVTIVNETFARTMWPNQDPLGRRISTGFEGGGGWMTVVGVVADYRVHRMIGEMPMLLMRPEKQRARRDGGILVVRADGDPLALAPQIRTAVRQLDSRVAVAQVTTMERAVNEALAEPLRLRFFLALFGLMGLVLGSVGIYGVVSYAVRRRWSELGIRLALGAEPGRLIWSVLRTGLAPVVLGILGGLGLTSALSRVLVSFVHGVAPTDPASLAAAAGVLLLVALVAAGLPALRASRVAPADALRAE